MPENNKIKQSIHNLRAEALKKAEETTSIDIQRSKEKEMIRRSQHDQDELQKLLNKGRRQDKKGNITTLWDELSQKADRLINSEQNAYHDWRSAMMEILGMYTTFVEALALEIKKKTVSFLMPVKQVVRESFLYPLKDKIIDKLTKQEALDVPTLVHKTGISKDHKLVIDGIKCEDSTLSKEFNKDFATLVTLWLHENKFELTKEGKYISMGDNKTGLTETRYKELQRSEQNSLGSFLKEHVGLNFKEDPEHQPSNRP